MFVYPDISGLKAKTDFFPSGYVDYLLAHGRIEGDKLVLPHNVQKNILKEFPELRHIKLNINQLKLGRRQMPQGYVDYVLARGKIEGDDVILDSAAQRDIRAEFPFLGIKTFNVALLKSSALYFPTGCVDYILARGKI